MSAETFVFTQLQSGALPTELSEVFPRTSHHYLILMKGRRDGKRCFFLKIKENPQFNPYLIIGRGICHTTRSLEWTIYWQNRPLD